MKIHILQHAYFETPGFIDDWAISKGHTLTYTNFDMAFTIPFPTNIDLLIIMGGPMSINDEDKYSWLREEKDYISDMIDKRKKVLGICLGSQLIADAMGEKVYKNTEKEIGWFDVSKNQSTDSPLFDVLPDKFTAFHWHGDTYDVPRGCDKLFTSDATANQAFSFKNRVFALQFHLEIKPENIDLMFENCRSDISEGDFVQSEESIIADKSHFEKNKDLIFKIMDVIEKL